MSTDRRVFLGRYESARLLGEGAMGRVFLAQDLKEGRQVVVKVMHEHVVSNRKFLDLFQREMTCMARFRHPYSVALYDSSIKDPQGPCIVMEYVKGATLQDLLTKHQRFDPVRVGRFLGQLCSVLQAAHAQGIIHRDLKPANIMIADPDTPAEKVKVMDFGLAMLVSSVYIPLEKLTGSSEGTAVGTPDYIAPEQIRGEEADGRADIYSLGAILFELLTGKVPFADRQSTDDILEAHLKDPPPKFARLGVLNIPPAIEAVVQRCLSKFPVERPQSAKELAQAYEKALGQKLLDKEEEFSPDQVPPPPPEPVIEEKIDPNAIRHQLEAWMPEKIAVVKLRGFVEDHGGEVLESVPGLIRVRLGGPTCVYQLARPEPAAAPKETGLLSWLGFSKKPPPPAGYLIEMELRMKKKENDPQSRLLITVLLRVEGGGPQPTGQAWPDLGDKVYRDLRAYLMGK